MKTMGGSYHNLAALAAAAFVEGPTKTVFRSPLGPASGSAVSLDSATGRQRLIIVSNVLPVRARRAASGWEFEWDEDALVAQAKEGLPDEYDVMFVGSLPVDVDGADQEIVAEVLKRDYGCNPVFVPPDLKEKYYKGFCKQQLWPLLHYVLPMATSSAGRFDDELWQAYIKANKMFAEQVVECAASDSDSCWIHDYHLLVLPSLLRKRFNRIRCGVFLHSPFPSSEIFRTFPKREELLRSMLNADVIGFHTFDYARHFLSCCSRLLGLEHETQRGGSISLEYYGRNVGIKIMPTGVNPQRLLDGFQWREFRWRRGELLSEFKDKFVFLGVDDMDVFKGIELKLQAYERLLDSHPEWLGRLVLVQITNAPRSTGRDVLELHEEVRSLVNRINAKHGFPGYNPVCYLERHVVLHERIAFYSVADCVVVTATRDGMNLVPYEYVVCRQGPDAGVVADCSDAIDDNGADTVPAPRESMLIVSEFVGCSPSLSGAIRVNPWSLASVADAMTTAVKMSRDDRRLRHEKHWRYVSQHTVGYWAASYMADLQRFTRANASMKCYGLGLGLDTFRMVALDANFRKLEEGVAVAAYRSARRRLFFLDYDGTLIPHSSINTAPPPDVLAVLGCLTADPANMVWLISGRAVDELGKWFSSLPALGLAAEHGFYMRQPGAEEWMELSPDADLSWKDLALSTMRTYQESTDGSWIEEKQSAVVWHYRDADPDFGNWQAKELLDHLEDVLSSKPTQVHGGATIVEVKPQGVSKGNAIDYILDRCSADAGPSSVGCNAPELQQDAGPNRNAGHEGMETDGLNSSSRGAGIGTEHVKQKCDGGQASGLSSVAAASTPPADFILAIGDDRSDEDMFMTIEKHTKSTQHAAEKPSRAPNYLDDTQEVLELLAKLSGAVLAARASTAF